jgi:hypothetical protein
MPGTIQIVPDIKRWNYRRQSEIEVGSEGLTLPGPNRTLSDAVKISFQAERL